MAKKKTNYEVTLSYKAIVQIRVKADTEEEAKEKALDYFKAYKHFGPLSETPDDNYAVQGVLNITETWDKLYD